MRDRARYLAAAFAMGESPSLTETGRRSARLVLPGSDWVHRRVQRISYLDPAMQRMQLSVDFTIPDGDIGSHVPISEH